MSQFVLVHVAAEGGGVLALHPLCGGGQMLLAVSGQVGLHQLEGLVLGRLLLLRHSGNRFGILTANDHDAVPVSR